MAKSASNVGRVAHSGAMSVGTQAKINVTGNGGIACTELTMSNADGTNYVRVTFDGGATNYLRIPPNTMVTLRGVFEMVYADAAAGTPHLSVFAAYV